MNSKANSKPTSSFAPSVEIIDDGYALCDKLSLQLVYANRVFMQWFKLDKIPINIQQIFPTFNPDTMLKRLAKRGTYSISIKLEQTQQKIPALLEITFKSIAENEQNYISMHAHNMTKLLEKDALIKSHSCIIEQSNRQLARLSKQLKVENNRLSAELEVTRKLQKFLLPTKDELLQINELDIACFMEPADKVGGDYYDILQHDDGIRISIGDVTGHGLESSMIMLMVQMGIRTLLASKITDAKQMLSILNHAIFANLVRINVDKSLSLAVLDYKDAKIRITGQHEEIIIVRKNGTINLLDTIDLGFPIGLDKDIADFIAETYVQLNSGDGIVLYTDGITEAANSTKQQYGIERLCAVIKNNWSKSAESIRDDVISELFHFIGKQIIFDDITLLVLKQK